MGPYLGSANGSGCKTELEVGFLIESPGKWRTPSERQFEG